MPKTNPSFLKEGKGVVYEGAGSMPVSEFVGEDRHHPNPSSEEEGLSVFIVSKSVPAPH